MKSHIKKLFLGAMVLLSITLFAGCTVGASQETTAHQKAVVEQAATLVKNKGPWQEILPLYQEMVTFEPVNSDARKETIRYLLDVDWDMVTAKKGQEALELALELDKLIPRDFYVQNRVIGAYRVLAEDAMAKKDWKTAYDYIYNKALRVRFDAEAMRTYLKLRTQMAQESIANKKYDDARTYLGQIIEIANIEDNKPLYKDENAAALKLLKSLPAK